jgi:hypothetical protein
VLCGLCLCAGYLGKETTVACNLMSGLANDLQVKGLQEEADYYKEEEDGIRAHIIRNMDGDEDAPAWCD